MDLYSFATAACALAVLLAAPPTRAVVLRLPGVLAHELAHWVMALLTCSSPSPIRIPWRRGKDNVVTYAEIEFTPGTFTAGMVAMAPLMATPWLVTALLSAGPLPAVAAASVLAHGYPSRADWKVLLIKPLSWPFAIAAVGLSYVTWWSTWIAP
jgi:hypothetical protein